MVFNAKGALDQGNTLLVRRASERVFALQPFQHRRSLIPSAYFARWRIDTFTPRHAIITWPPAVTSDVPRTTMGTAYIPSDLWGRRRGFCRQGAAFPFLTAARDFLPQARLTGLPVFDPVTYHLPLTTRAASTPSSLPGVT